MSPRLSVCVASWLALCLALALTIAERSGAAAQSAPRGVIRVAPGDDLQAALDRAKPGDTILLASGARFTGNFVLPVHEGTEPVTIRTDAAGLPAPGTRTSPRHAAALAHIQSPSNLPALRTAPRAHHWRIENVAFGPNRGGEGNIVALGDDSTARREEIPHHFVFDRVYIYGDPAIGQKRGIALNSGATEIVNSHISDIKATGVDAQAICGWNGPGPYKIENNYLEASGENILFGGADPSVDGLIPTDITITRNHITRPVSWREPLLASPAAVRAAPAGDGRLAAGSYVYTVVAERRLGRGETALSSPAPAAEVRLDATGSVTVDWEPVQGAEGYRVYRSGGSGKPSFFRAAKAPFTDAGEPGSPGSPRARGTVWQVKNLLELKTGRDVKIDGNLFEHHWAGAQSGYALLFKPGNQNGGAPWTTVENVELTNNVVRHVGGGININGRDPEQPSGRARGFVIRNNLFAIDKKTWGGPGDFIQIGNGPADVTIEGNTVIHDGRILSLYAKPIEGFVFRGNVLRHNQYGVKGEATGIGRASLDAFAPGGSFAGNVIGGGKSSSYPEGNRFVDEQALDAALAPAAQARAGAHPDGQAFPGAGVEWAALEVAFSANTSVPAARVKAPPGKE